MREAERCEELSVMVIDGSVEVPSDLILHDKVLIDAATDIVVLIGVVPRDER